MIDFNELRLVRKYGHWLAVMAAFSAFVTRHYASMRDIPDFKSAWAAFLKQEDETE